MRTLGPRQAFAALALLVMGGLSCGEEGLVIPETPSVDLTAVAAADVRVAAGRATQIVFGIAADVPHRLLATGTTGTTADSFVVIVRANDGVTELSRMTVAGGNAPARRILLPPFPAAERLPVEVRGLRPSDAGTVSLSAVLPSTAPEDAPAALTLADTIVELFDGWDDVDRYTATFTAGQQVLLYLGKFGASVATGVGVQVFSPGSASSPIANELFTTVSNSLEERSVAFTAAFTGTYQIVVRGPAAAPNLPVWSIGSYRMALRVVTRTPESASATVVLGDTLSEALDFVGDEDRFSIPITAGQPIQLRVRLGRDLPSFIRFTLEEPGLGPSEMLAVAAGTTWPNAYVSTEYVPGTTGTATLVVRGASAGIASQILSSYDFVIGPPQRAPETASGTLAVGATLSSELLDGCADQDEFVITPTEDRHVAIGVARPADAGCALIFELLHPSNSVLGESGTVAGRAEDLDSLRLSRPLLRAGVPYRLRVRANRLAQFAAAPTPYTIDVYAVDSLPESAPSVIALSDVAFSESIVRCGDLDSFTMPLLPFGTIGLLSGRVDRNTRCELRADVLDGGNAAIGGLRLNGRLGGDLDSNSVSLRIGGPGQRLLLSANASGSSADRGALVTLRVDTVSVGPEFAASAAALGDTLAETIRRCGDVDEFTLTGPPGEEVYVSSWLSRGLSCAVSLFQLRPSFTDSLLAVLQPDSVTAERLLMRLPASGSVTYRVVSAAVGATADRGAGYRLAFTRRNIEPEFVSVALAVDDTVTAETLIDANDVDRYFVNLEAGKRYSLLWSGSIRAVLEGPSTSIILSDNQLFAQNLSSYTYGVTVPTTGQYRLRVTPSPVTAAGTSNSPYTFALHELRPGMEGPGPFELGTQIVELLAPYGEEDNFELPSVRGAWYARRFEYLPGTDGFAYVDLGGMGGFGRSGAGMPLVFRADSSVLTVRVFGTVGTATGYGGYELLLWMPDTMPETAPALLTLGDSVTNEAIDEPGDIDVYEIPVAAGQRVEFALQSSPSCDPVTLLGRYEGPGLAGDVLSFPDVVWYSAEPAPAAMTLRITITPVPDVCSVGAYKLLTRLVP